MSFLPGLFGGGGSRSKSETTQQDNRQVNDASGGGVVGSNITLNILGDNVARLFNMGQNQAASPFASIADANGMRSDGIGGQAAGLLGSPVLLMAVAGLVAVVILKR